MIRNRLQQDILLKLINKAMFDKINKRGKFQLLEHFWLFACQSVHAVGFLIHGEHKFEY